MEISEKLQDVGISALAIHGRTRCQMYKGDADWTLIGDVKNNPRITMPIIGNGDITTPERAKEVFDRYGVDGVMIGRGAIGRPWFFKEVRHFLDTGEILPFPSVSDRVALAKRQLTRSVDWKGSPRGIYEMRRHYINYFKGLPHFKDFKLKLVTSLDLDEIFLLLDNIENQYSDDDFIIQTNPHNFSH